MGISVSEQVDEIVNMYEILEDNDEAEIRKFIEERDYLFPVLIEAKDQIISVFGDKIKICLDLHHDPEEAWDELFIVIKSSYSPKEAVELENRLAENWFLSRMKDTKGDLNFSEEPL
jgi:hypothetical protein